MCSCAGVNGISTGYVKVSSLSGECEQSYFESLDKDTYKVAYFCGQEGTIIIKVKEK